MARKFIVDIPIADLCSKPEEIPILDYSHQDLRETQLLFGETLTCLEDRGEWLRVAALEQPVFDNQNGWHPYIGWVKRSEVKEVDVFATPTHVVCTPHTYSYGTYLQTEYSRPIPKNFSRQLLIEDALKFVGRPYLWGGRSFSQNHSSVDCSGLLNLLYRAQGIIIPRNAHDQYLKSTPIQELQPADPLFLAKEKRISHVLLKIDETTFIESPETSKPIRLLRWGTDIWQDNLKIQIFDRPHAYHSFCGRLV